ncbi:MAG: site-2 protease family protein [Puniceicoccales bacterium]|nr:site-2 protease family protein [Puniceicoccales bacterium]
MILSQLGGIFATVLALGGSILVHEFGHYWAARRLGLCVFRFSIGFGPRLFSWQRGETEFCLSALPIGGYVALPQMEIGPPPPPLCPIDPWKRCATAAMGPLANLALALALASGLWILGQPLAPGDRNCTVGALAPALGEIWQGDPDAVPCEGDRILAVDGVPLDRLGDLSLRVALGTALDGEGQPIARLRVERNGQILDLAVPVLRHGHPGGPSRSLRSLPVFPAQPTVVRSVLPRSPAELAGLAPGDEILACGGIPVHSPTQLQQILDRIEKTGGPVDLELRRQGIRKTLPILPAAGVEIFGHLRARLGRNVSIFLPGTEPGTWLPATGKKIPRTRQELEAKFQEVEEVPPQLRFAIGVALDQIFILEHGNPFRTVGRCIGETAHTLRALISPRSDVHVRHLMGVAGMARTLHRLSLDDIRGLLHFAMAINVGLALLNLLPIPALDGGHICLALLGKIFPLPERLVRRLHGCCLLLLLALLAHVTVLDLFRWREDSRARALGRELATLRRTPQF